MGLFPRALPRPMDGLTLLLDRFISIEWVFVAACIDTLFGFLFSGLAFSLLFRSRHVFVLSALLNVTIFAAFALYVFKNFDFQRFYDHWTKSSVKDYGDIAKLNETASFYASNSSSESRKIFKSANESNSLFLADTSVLSNSSLRQRSFNNASGDSCYTPTDRSFQASDEKTNVVPAKMLISSTSPYSMRHLFTEGHYNAMIFDNNTSNNSTFDEDFFASKKLDWIFSSGNLSSSEQNSGSYQVGFINKDKVSDADDQKSQSESKDLFNSYVNAELDADDGIDSIFGSHQKKSKSSTSPKRDALLKKIAEWNDEKNSSLDESTKKQHMQILLDELFANATIHRITFNNAVATDLAYFSANLRRFLSKHVIKPIVNAIDESNQKLLQFGANFSIGSSAVDVLLMALEQKPELRYTQIPYLLPFLRIHSNQKLLVNKFRQFAQKPFVLHETLVSRGFEKLSGFGSSKVEPEFLSEEEFIFMLFCTYLDYRMDPNAFAKDVEKPFSSVYILNESEKPSIVQLRPKSFYIYSRNKKITSYDFVINGGLDFYVTPTSGTEKMFAAFMLLIIYSKQFNDGYLGNMRVDHSGLDLLRLFRSH